MVHDLTLRPISLFGHDAWDQLSLDVQSSKKRLARLRLGESERAIAREIIARNKPSGSSFPLRTCQPPLSVRRPRATGDFPPLPSASFYTDQPMYILFSTRGRCCFVRGRPLSDLSASARSRQLCNASMPSGYLSPSAAFSSFVAQLRSPR